MKKFGLIRDAEHKRKLTSKDFARARVGERLWNVTLDQIPDAAPYKKHVAWYIDSLEKNISEGTGLFFGGQHGSGKSGAAVVIVKEVMARGGSALFLEEASLIDAVLQKEVFADDMLVHERAREVDLLVIDDLGLSPQSDNLHVTETLMKNRTHRKRSTIITTNLEPADFVARYKTISNALKETSLPVTCDGVDWRERLKKGLQDRFKAESGS